jgi:hypothetical protein
MRIGAISGSGATRRQFGIAVVFTLILALMPKPPAPAANEKLPVLRGTAAARYLQQQGLYGSLNEAIQAAQFTIHPVTGKSQYVASNPAQRLGMSFSPAGMELQSESWRISWRLRSAGYGDRPAMVGPARLEAIGARIELRHEGGIAEWFVNSAAGLEQGFTLSRPPRVRPKGKRLRLELELQGDLRARAERSGQGVELAHPDGTVGLRYANLLVTDAAGRKLPVEMGVASGTVWLEVEDAGASWPITVDPTFAQQAYLKAFNTGIEDNFGDSVAVSGDTVVVGAPFESSNATGVNGADNDLANHAGAAYVFVRSGSSWIQQAYLKASNAGAEDDFGWSVAVSGDTVVVGAILEDSNATVVNGADNDLAEESGAAYVFVRTGSTWTQQAYLKASNTKIGLNFGESVAVSGDTVVVGSSGDGSNATGVNGPDNNLAPGSGAAWVFVRNGSTWSQQAYLKASNAGAGVSEGFGSSVAVSGDTVVVGAPGEDSFAPQSGAAYVFVRNGSTWSQQAYLKASNKGQNDVFGTSVGVSGDTIVVGAPEESSNATGVDGADNDLALASGAAYIFVRSGSTWSQQAYLKASNTGKLDGFGDSVAVSGDTVVVGAPGESSNATGVNGADNNSADNSGAAYVFVRSGSTWSQQAYLKASNTGKFDGLGSSVAASGGTLVVGAPGESSNATGVNGADNDLADGSGAAYVFSLPNTPPSITPSPVTRQQGTSASATIATVSDAEDTAGTLGVTAQSSNPSNGVTVSSIVNSAGNITAEVAAACSASNASFTLRVTDSGGLHADGALNVTVTPSVPIVSTSVGNSSLWPPNHDLVNVGLTASATGNCSPVLLVAVFANEDDQTLTGSDGPFSPDATGLASGTLRLRAERLESGSGRVYLIVAKAHNSGGNTGFSVATVVVPKSQSAKDIAGVNTLAASARSHALAHNGSAPVDYFVVGDGPVAGPKQ